MKARNREKIGIFYVNTAHRDLSEICCLCSDFINARQWYVRGGKKSKIAHYRCAKRAGWKKEPPDKRQVQSEIAVKPKQVDPRREQWFNDPKLKFQRRLG